MSVISLDYFNSGIRNIPNIDAPEIDEAVTSLIEEFEPKYLKGVLGYSLYKAFENERIQLIITDRTQQLLTGYEFTYCGELMRWDGFSNITTLESPIADYVMSNYVSNQSGLTGGVGEIRPKSEHADVIDPLPKVMQNWNSMVSKNAVLYAYLTSNKELYPEFDGRVDPVFFKPINYLGI